MAAWCTDAKLSTRPGSLGPSPHCSPILLTLTALPIIPDALVLPRPVSGACPLAAISMAPELVLRLIPALEADVAVESRSRFRG